MKCFKENFDTSEIKKVVVYKPTYCELPYMCSNHAQILSSRIVCSISCTKKECKSLYEIELRIMACRTKRMTYIVKPKTSFLILRCLTIDISIGKIGKSHAFLQISEEF